MKKKIVLNNNVKFNYLILSAIVGFFLIIFGNFLFIDFKINEDEINEDVLKIISSSENILLDASIKEFAKKEKININIEYADTLDMMAKVNSNENYDAIWSSNSIWLYLIDSKNTTITNSKSMSINPVIFGIKKSKANELGFIDKEVYVKDIVDKIETKELKFAMSNPTSSNSGASAYLGFLSTLAGNPEVLTSETLNNPELKNKLKTFFSGLERTSGDEDFLEELFLKGDYEAVVAYESSIININKTLIKQNKEPLYAIYPVDGVSISDSTLSFIDHKTSQKKDNFLKIQNYFLSSNGQKILENYGRRTWYGGISNQVDKLTFNPEWGINTTKYITPIKYPNISVIKEALLLYQAELRKPVHVVFCLDYSGSMSYEGINELIEAMNYILGEEAAYNYIQFSAEDKIDIIPFSTEYNEVWSHLSGDKFDNLINKIQSKTPIGSTALFPAAQKALSILKDTDKNLYNTSVILMTDGQGNIGSYEELASYYEQINQNIPIYSIMFGSADEIELLQMANLSNGKIFDGKNDLIEAFKNVRGYN